MYLKLVLRYFFRMDDGEERDRLGKGGKETRERKVIYSPEDRVRVETKFEMEMQMLYFQGVFSHLRHPSLPPRHSANV
jgi:hypothetical protein